MPSVLATVLLAFVLICGLSAVIGNQVTGLAENLTQYQYNIKEKIESLRGMSVSGGLIQRASAVLDSLRREAVKTPPVPAPSRTSGGVPVAAPSNQPQKPLLVEIRQPDPEPLEIIQNVIGPLLGPLTTTSIVVVFVVFFLLQREDLRDRFIRLAGGRDLRRTTEALDDASHRLSRYLLIELRSTPASAW